VDFDLTDLRLFVQIAETKSLTHGAQRCYMSLPAASVRVKSVEERLGTKLLYRTAQGVILTPAGKAFLHHGRMILQNIEHLAGDLQEFAQGLKGHLRFFANATTVTEYLPAALSAYLLDHPGINIELSERGSCEIIQAVAEHTADIGIAAGPVVHEDIRALPYRRDRLVLVTSSSHPFAQREVIDFEETLNFDYVGLVESCSIQTLLTQEARNRNQALSIRIRVGNFESLCRMVETNVGVGILPASAARRHAKTMSINIVSLSDEWAVRDLIICTNRNSVLPSFVDDLIALLIESVVAEVVM
jgi:DNA-binding transcriptional LysR family regulator